MRFRKQAELGMVVVGWRAPVEDVRTALEHEQVPAALGPSSGGWATARLLVDDAGSVVEPRGRDVGDLLDDLARTLGAPGLSLLVGEDGAALLLVCSGTAAPVSAEVPALGAGAEPDRAAWAAVLGALDRLDVLGPALELVAAGPPGSPSLAALAADRRGLELAALLGLPAALGDPNVLDEPAPWREAVVGRGLPAADVALAAHHAGGPLLLADAADGSSAVVAVEPDGRVLLPAAVQLAPLRTPVLLLWRRGRSRGWLLVRLGRIAQAHVWSDAWSLTALDPTLEAAFRQELAEALLPQEGDAAVLAERLGGPGTDVVGLRTVLRRAPGPDCLPDLLQALGLDASAARAVEADGPDPLPGGRALEPVSGARAMWHAASAPRPSDPWVMRVSQRKPWWYRLVDLLFAVLAGAWAVGLWDGGGGLARTGAVVLVLLAVGSVVDAVTPGWGKRASTY